jgi:predicted patatin/cPLA2 family phospholipase
MTDDLVKRLECYADLNYAVYHPWVYREAANRIEKLELIEKAFEQNQQVWSRNIARIEKLEAALREIANGQRDANKSYAELFVEVCTEARKALDAK